MRRYFSIFLASAIVSTSVEATAHAHLYKVKPGETFSEVAQKFLGKPVYPSHTGSLYRLKRLNPHITNINKIFPGQILFLENAPERHLAQEDDSTGPQVVATPSCSPSPIAAPIPVSPPEDPLVAEGPPTRASPLPASHLGLEVGVYSLRLDNKDKSNGSNATLMSSMNPQAHLIWSLDWNSQWRSHLKFGYATYKIEDDTSFNPRTIKNNTGYTLGFEAGGTRKWSDGSQTGIAIGARERIYLRGISPTALDVDRVSTPFIKIRQEEVFAQVQGASLGVQLSAELLLPGRGAGFNTENGLGAEGGFFVRHRLRTTTLQGQVFYSVINQDSSLVNQTEQSVGALFHMIWQWGD